MEQNQQIQMYATTQYVLTTEIHTAVNLNKTIGPFGLSRFISLSGYMPN